MKDFQEFICYPVIVLLAIFLVIFSFKLLLRLVLLCIGISILWVCLFYLEVVPAPWELFPEVPQIWNSLKEYF